MIPPRTVLSAADFSDASHASLHCAARLAARCGAALHVMHAIDPLLAVAAKAQHIDLPADTRAELVTFCREAGLPSAVTPALHVKIGGVVRHADDSTDANFVDEYFGAELPCGP